jgi:hypothetical protein
LRKKHQLIEKMDFGLSKIMSQVYSSYAPLSCRLTESALKAPQGFPRPGLEIVCFVNGCTQAEITACHMISDKIVIITSEIFNRNSFIKSLMN